MPDSTASQSPNGGQSPIDQQHFNRLMEISNRLLKSLYLFDRSEVWKAVTKEIRELYACELATLFLVDDDDPNYLILEAQDPPRENPEELRVHIISQPGQGITGHVAKMGRTTSFNANDLKTSPYVKNRNPTYLPSGRTYSTLFAPLKNRKGRLIGLLRLNNKNIKAPADTPFTKLDESTIEFLGTEIVALLENAHAIEAIHKVLHDIPKATTTDEVVETILTQGLRLVHGDYAKFALWSSSKRQLVLAGSLPLGGEFKSYKGDVVDEDNVMWALWQQLSMQHESSGPDDGLVWKDFGPFDSQIHSLVRCHPSARKSISIVLKFYQDPVGVLHIEGFDDRGFDELDQQALKALGRNVTLAVQSIPPPWALHLEIDSGEEIEQVSISENIGFYQTILKNIPLVLWRKDRDGRFVWVNDEFCETVNLKRSQILGKTDFQIFPLDKARRFRNGDEIAMAAGVFEDEEEEYPSAEGEIRYIHVIKRALYDFRGKVIGTQGVFLDVTGDKYRELFNEAPIGFHELDEQGIALHVNEAEQHLLEFSEAEFQSKPYWEFCATDADKEVTRKHIENQLNSVGDEGVEHPVNLKKKNGVNVPVILLSRRRRTTTGKRGLLCAIHESSAGYEIESALRDPDSRYLMRIRELNLPVFCVDQQAKVSFANEAYLKRDGLDFEKIKGKDGVEIYGADGEPYHRDTLDVLTSGKVLDRFEVHKGPDGKKDLVRVIKFPIRDSHTGKVVGVQGVFWNYEDQDQAKKELTDALEAAKEEYRQIVNRASEGIYQCTFDGQFIAANPAMLSLMGFENESALFASEKPGIERFARVEDRNRYFLKLRSRASLEPVQFTYRLRKRSGEECWVSETFQRATPPGSPGVERFVGFVKDVTTELENAERIQTSLKEKEEMLKLLTHQLRSPAWQAYERASLLVDDLDPSNLLHQGKAQHPIPRLAAIRGLTRKTRAVAWSIDMLSKLAADDKVVLSQKKVVQPWNLVKMARESAMDVQMLRKLPSRFLERVGRRTDVPEFKIDDSQTIDSRFRIWGESDLIEQCVSNLIENAFKYSMPKSTIQIAFVLEYKSTTLTVRNQPLPSLEIDAETKIMCRKKEWRSKGAAASDADGSGIGLWLVDRIMTAHEGELRVEETDESGWNTFSLYFPLLFPRN